MVSNLPQGQPPAAPDYKQKAGDWAVSDDIAQMAFEFASFCDKVVALSLADTPPGVNAANGNFAHNMVTDGTLSSLAPPRVTPHSDESSVIYRFTADFEQGLRSAFMPGSVKSNWTKSAALFKDFVTRFPDQIKGIVEDIAGAFVAHAAIPAALAKVASDVSKLKEAIDKSGVKFDGENANGWIQKNVRDLASRTKVTAEALKIGKSAEANNYLNGMIKVCNNLNDKIPEFDNDPWLVGAWQLAFQAVMGATAESFKQFPATMPAAPHALGAGAI